MSKKIVCIIPARSGSKGIKNKNICLLGGYPLIAYSILASKLCGLITETFVSTDSAEIGLIAENFGANWIVRPPELATDTSTDLEWVKHALTIVDADLIIFLRCTTPLRNIQIIKDSIVKFLQISEATSLRTAHMLNESPAKMFIEENGWFKPFIPSNQKESFNLPRQNFTEVWHPNGIVDIIKPEIVKTDYLYGNNILALKTPKIIEVDSYDDLLLLEQKLNQEGHFLWKELKKLKK